MPPTGPPWRLPTPMMMTVNSNLSFQPSRNCGACGMPLAPGAGACARCATAVVAPLATGPVVPQTFRHGGLSAGDRFVAMGVDVALAVLTGGIGWLVWTALLAKKGQTPAKKLRDHVVINSQTARVVSTGRFFARELIVASMFMYLVVGAIWGYGLIIDIGGYWINSFVIPLVIAMVIAVDIAWMFMPARRRLIDVVLSTNVVHGEGYSYQTASVSMGAGV